MGTVILIPESYLMFIAIKANKMQSVKMVQFIRLKELVRIQIREELRGITAFTRDESVRANFYVEDGEIKTSLNYTFDEMYTKYKDEIVINIHRTFDISYYQAKEVLSCAIARWTGKV